MQIDFLPKLSRNRLSLNRSALVRFGGILAMFAFLAVMTSEAATATVIRTINTEGQLTGARNVDVGGTLYNVSFLDGSCAEHFNGCDELSDFVFTDFSDAEAAARALLEQVFLDVLEGAFDSDPSLTFGCSLSLNCFALIPSGFHASGRVISAAANNQPGNGDDTEPFALFPDTETISGDNRNLFFAKFSVTQEIPEPSSLLLLGLGLAGLAGFGAASGRFRRQSNLRA